MSPSRVSLWKLPVAAGLLYFLAFFSGLLVPNVVAFLPLLLWLDLQPAAPRLRRMWAGFFFGLGAYVPGLHFHYAMLDYSWLAAVLYVGMVLAFSVKTSLLTALLGWLRARTRWPMWLLLPLTWVPCEWLQTWGDFKMTADHFGQSLAGFPFLVQFADLAGAYGVAIALFAVNGMVYEAVCGFYASDRRRGALALAVTLAAVLVYDGIAWSRALVRLDVAGTLRVGLIQPNIPIQVKRDAGTYRQQWPVIERLTREAVARGAEVVIWPESARPWPLVHELDRPQSYHMPDVAALARELDVSILVGVEYARGPVGGPFDVYNAAMLVHDDGRLDESWGAKVYLVPFTEGVPFESLLGPLVRGRGGEWIWVAGGFAAAPRSALLPVRVRIDETDDAGRRDGGDVDQDPEARHGTEPGAGKYPSSGTPEDAAATIEVGVLVCYEQLFYDLARGLRNRGSDIQAVITNDAWFGRSLFQRFQADVLRLRAIENRTSFVRVANTGISGFVDPLGRYRHRTRLYEEAVEVEDVAVSGPRTLYDRIGDVAAWLMIPGLAGAVLRARARRRPR